MTGFSLECRGAKISVIDCWEALHRYAIRSPPLVREKVHKPDHPQVEISSTLCQHLFFGGTISLKMIGPDPSNRSEVYYHFNRKIFILYIRAHFLAVISE